MDREIKILLLAELIELQERTSPISIRIGSISDNVCLHNEIVISKAPPAVFKILEEFKKKMEEDRNVTIFIEAARGGITIW